MVNIRKMQQYPVKGYKATLYASDIKLIQRVQAPDSLPSVLMRGIVHLPSR